MRRRSNAAKRGAMRMKPRDVPTRLATGVYIMHSAQDKWHVDEERAAGLHKLASGAYPMFRGIPAGQFVKGLSIAEHVVAGALLAPFVPAAVAGAVLTGFAGGLVTMYLRTPSLRKPGSIWPNQAGGAMSKDIWMLGIGAGLLIGAACDRKQAASEEP